MVDWLSEKVEAVCQDVYVRFVSFLLGVFLYYFCLSFKDVELPLLLRRQKFVLPYVPYLIGRYSALAGALLTILIFNADYGGYCGRLLRGLPILAAIVVTCSSTNIMLRPLALYRRNRLVLCTLLVFLIAHWCMSVAGFFIVLVTKPSPLAVPRGARCAAAHPAGMSRNHIIIIFYLFTMLWDAVILILTIVGLYKRTPAHSTPLWLTLYRQGIGYLVATLALNLPMLVLTILNLNAAMNVFFATPGAMVSVMVSSAAVVSLMKTKVGSDAAPADTMAARQGSDNHIPIDVKAQSEPSNGILTTQLTMPPSIQAVSEIDQQEVPPIPLTSAHSN